jgi:hypothetical protein
MLQVKEGQGDDPAVARPAGVAGSSPSVKDSEGRNWAGSRRRLAPSAPTAPDLRGGTPARAFPAETPPPTADGAIARARASDAACFGRSDNGTSLSVTANEA